MRKLISAMGALVLLWAVAGSVLGHSTTKEGQYVAGSVDCQGGYTIMVRGDVYGDTHLVVTLGGTIIFDDVTGQDADDSSTQNYGPFIGIGGFPGEEITAYPSDGVENKAIGTLAGPEENCSPPPTPSPTPSSTLSPTPEPSLPNTAM